MEELSDLALLGIGAGALVIVYLLRVMWGLRGGKPRAQPKRRGRKPSKSNISVIVDGSNVMHWGGEPSEIVLVRVILAIIAKGYEPYVIFDANVGYKLRGKYLDDAPMARLIGLPVKQVLVVEKGVVADELILQVATERGLKIVSNDRFRDWSVTYPIVRKKGQILRGTANGGGVRWQGI